MLALFNNCTNIVAICDIKSLIRAFVNAFFTLFNVLERKTTALLFQIYYKFVAWAADYSFVNSCLLIFESQE